MSIETEKLMNLADGKILYDDLRRRVDANEAYYIQKTSFTNPTTVNSNASSVINAGILATATAGKQYCVIPDGEYWLTETVYLADGVILCGSGMDATTLKIADGCDIDAIRVHEPINNSGIMDLAIDGNRITNYSTFSNGHHGNAINVWLHYGRIERVRTNWVYKHSLMLNYDTGSGDDGLEFEPAHQNDMGNLNKVLWCDFKDSLLQGVMWGWRTMDSWMCYTNIGSHAANLYLEGGTSRFIGNHFDGDGDNGNGPEYNVYCGDGCTAMLFSENIFENTQKENIFFRQPSYRNGTRTITIANNIIRTCSKTTNNTYANVKISGYDATTKAEQITITGNQILNPDTNANHGYAGIHLDYCKDVKIGGNTYFNVGADNVKIESTCQNCINDDEIASELSDVKTEINSKADEPTGTKTAGKVYGLDSNGHPAWVDGGGSVDPAVIAQAVDDWLDEHPEATTTIQDGAVSYQKLDQGLQENIDQLTVYSEITEGNMIDVSEYEGETHKITSEISVSTAKATFELYCCGKNHAKLTADSGGVNGFTWVRSTDGTITLNGTTDRNYSIAITDVLCIYNTKWRASIQKSAENSGVYLFFNNTNKGDSFEFGASSTAYAKNITVYVAKNTACDNLVVRPMVEFGDYPVAISYEAFKGFSISHTFDSPVSSGSIDWGNVTIPEDVDKLWMYDFGNSTTIFNSEALAEKVAEQGEAIESAYSHDYTVDVHGWSDQGVTFSNGYITSAGAVQDNSSFRHSNYIPCAENDLIYYNLYGYSSSVYIVTFYNASKARISGIVGKTGYMEGTATAPANAAYVVFSTSNSYTGDFSVNSLHRVTGDGLKTALKNYTDERTSIGQIGVKLTRGNVPIIEGSICSNQGANNIWDLSQGRRTDFIPVSEGDTVKYRCYAYIGSSVKTYTLAMFDSEKSLINHVEADETGVIDGTYTVVSGVAFVMVSWLYAMTQDGWFEITAASYPQTLESFVKDKTIVEESVLNGKQWCCLGDSITYGANTTKVYFNFIEDRVGITPWNFGASNTAIAKKTSAVTDNMATRYSGMYDDVDYVTVLGGTNDHGQSITIGEWGDADQLTLYGAMKILCEGLIAKYIGKKIGFILPLPKYTTTSGGVSTDYSYPNASFGAYIECIHDVCKRYSIPVLDLYLESGLAVGNASVRTALIPDGLHPNATGHEYISRKIQTFLESL